MLIAVIPLIAAVVGALLYALSTSPKVAELGRLTFATGMLALLIGLASKTIKLLA